MLISFVKSIRLRTNYQKKNQASYNYYFREIRSRLRKKCTASTRRIEQKINSKKRNVYVLISL
jgi:hypothetical protein